MIEYPHANQTGGLGLAIIDGFVYRGNALPQFTGHYIFGDWSTSFVDGDCTLFVATRPAEEGKLGTLEELRIATTESSRNESC